MYLLKIININEVAALINHLAVRKTEPAHISFSGLKPYFPGAIFGNFFFVYTAFDLVFFRALIIYESNFPVRKEGVAATKSSRRVVQLDAIINHAPINALLIHQ